MRFARDPLLHFLLLGAVTFAVVRHFDEGPRRYEIDAGVLERTRLAAMYAQQYGVTPTPDQLQQLLDQYVRGEILYREGRAMGLDQGDEIVRRRVIQKVEFLNEDLDLPPTPGRAALEAFFDQHAARYDSPATVSFTQIFFSIDRDGSTHAQERAAEALVRLRNAESTAGLADPFVDGNDFSNLTAAGAATVFGASRLTESLFSLPVGEWRGPFQSGLGWHVVRVSARQSAHPCRFEQVEDRVRNDYSSALREQRNADAFRRIASKYRVLSNEPRA